MKNFLLAAGVAALAITASPASAQGNGKGNQKSESAKADRGGGKARAAKADRGGDKARGAKAERRSADRAETRSRAKVQRARAERRDDRRDRAVAQRRDRDDDRRVVRAMRDRDDERRIVRNRDRDDDRRIVRNRDRDDNRRFAGRGLYGCPPGLAKKRNGCLPPGQAKKLIGQRVSDNYRLSALPRSLRNIYRDNDDYTYRYRDNYVYRVNRESQVVSSLLPLLGAGLGLGQVFPTSYSNAYVPNSYQSFYRDNSDDYYRYANGYVYEVDRGSGLIENMIPLMASGYGVGQMLPAGYSAYNVPYQYRDRYADSSDAYYRYAPGAIYQVDPQSNLITSVASLLSPNGFSVGQSLPAGYGTYNVPYQYRDDYYDTADNMYRYNNGNIYRVDPTTQLITALVKAIV